MVGWTHTTVHKHYEIMQRELEMTQMMSPPAWILVQLLRLWVAVILYVVISQRVLLELKGIRRILRPFRSERGKVPNRFPHGWLDTFRSSSSPFYRAQFWNHAEEKRSRSWEEMTLMLPKVCIIGVDFNFSSIRLKSFNSQGLQNQICCRD